MGQADRFRLRGGIALGVEVDDEWLRYVLVRRDRHGWRAIRSGEVDPALSATAPDRAAEAFRAMLALLKGDRRGSLVLGLSGRDAVARTVEVPRIPPAEAEAAAILEISQYLPCPLDEVSARALILPSEGEQGPLEVLVMAAHANYLEEWLLGADAAGLLVHAVELPAYALRRLLPAGVEEAVIINARAREGELCAYRAGELVFSRSFALPGEEWDGRIASELRRGIDYLTRDRRLKGEPSLFLTGISSEAPAVKQLLEGTLGQPLADLAVPATEELAGRYAVSLALALGGVGLS